MLKVKRKYGQEIHCIVYIANSEKIKTGLKPTKEYLERILTGKKYMSDDYYEQLKRVETYD